MYIQSGGRRGLAGALQGWRRRAAAAFLALLAAAAAGCAREEPDPGSGERVFTVESAAAREEVLGFRLELGGEVQPGRRVMIIPATPGRVASIPVQEGQAVSRGDLLLHLENTSQELQLRQAQAAVDVLAAELARVEVLVEAGALPEKNLRDLQGQLQQAELARDLARYAYDQTILKSPLDGVVTAVSTAEGELVGTSAVMAVLSQEGVTVQAVVDEGQLYYFSPGMTVQVQVPAVSEEFFTGTVSSVGQAAIPGSRSFPVEVEVESTAGAELRSGMYALVLVEESGWRGLQVPASALLERDGTSCLFIVREGRAEQRPVATGLRRAGQVEIVEGLSSGEHYIVRLPAGLKDGSPVEEN